MEGYFCCVDFEKTGTSFPWMGEEECFMTDLERKKIDVLRKQGLGYKKIAADVGLSLNTVKSYCKSHPVSYEGTFCLQCGTEVKQTAHKRQRKYCSDACRAAWWSAHPEARKSSRYPHTCAFCGKEFSSDRSASKYCSTLCYANARKKVEHE